MNNPSQNSEAHSRRGHTETELSEVVDWKKDAETIARLHARLAQSVAQWRANQHEWYKITARYLKPLPIAHATVTNALSAQTEPVTLDQAIAQVASFAQKPA